MRSPCTSVCRRRSTPDVYLDPLTAFGDALERACATARARILTNPAGLALDSANIYSMLWIAGLVGAAWIASLNAPASGLSESEIAAVVRERKPAVRRVCFEPVAAKQQGEVRVRVTAKLRIDPRGVVTSSQATGAEQLPTLAPCVARELGKWLFPASDEETIISIPFAFVEAR